MNNIDSIIEHCKSLVLQPEHRRRYLKSIQERSNGIIGYFSNYIPPELIAAAGFHPLRIIGHFGAGDGQPMFHSVCSFVQDVLAAARAGEFAELDGIIFPNSCDSLKALQQVWEAEFKSLSCRTLRHSLNTDPSAVNYYAAQLKELAMDLQKTSGHLTSENTLREVILEYNDIRGLIRQIYELRQTGQSAMSYADWLAVMTAGLMMDRTEYADTLRQILEQGRHNPASHSGKRILIAGPLVDHYPLIAQMEELGASIVADDITNGWRFCDHDVSIEGDLYEALAHRILLSSPSPTLNAPSGDADFVHRVRQLGVQGVGFINQQCCEPQVHSYLSKSRLLESFGIQSLLINVEHGEWQAQEHDLLRIESFLELAAKA